MSESQATPRPPETPEFGLVSVRPVHDYPAEAAFRVEGRRRPLRERRLCDRRRRGGADRRRCRRAGAAPRPRRGTRRQGHPADAQPRRPRPSARCVDDALDVPVFAHPSDPLLVEFTPVGEGDTFRVGDATVTAPHPGAHAGERVLRARELPLLRRHAVPRGPGPDRRARAVRRTSCARSTGSSRSSRTTRGCAPPRDRHHDRLRAPPRRDVARARLVAWPQSTFVPYIDPRGSEIGPTRVPSGSEKCIDVPLSCR